jgi:hypothetical protein
VSHLERAKINLDKAEEILTEGKYLDDDDHAAELMLACGKIVAYSLVSIADSLVKIAFNGKKEKLN